MQQEGPSGEVRRCRLCLDGVSVSYLERGVARAGTPSLVVLHGLMGCAETFVPMLQAFDDDQHVIALDLPGAGQSERNAAIDASLAATADLVAQMIELLGLRRPIVIGHSHGGAVTMSLAARYRELLHSIVLMAPAHPWFDESDPIIRFYLTLPGRLFAYTMPWYPQWMQLIGLRRMAGPKSWDTPERLRPYRENLRTPGTMAHLLRLLRTWHNDMARLARHLAKRPLEAPVLLIWGDADRAVPVQSAARLREKLGHTELIVLPGVGHRPGEEAPDFVAGLVTEWIAANCSAATVSGRYSANSVVSHSRSTPLMTPSFEAGD